MLLSIYSDHIFSCSCSSQELHTCVLKYLPHPFFIFQFLPTCYEACKLILFFIPLYFVLVCVPYVDQSKKYWLNPKPFLNMVCNLKNTVKCVTFTWYMHICPLHYLAISCVLHNKQFVKCGWKEECLVCDNVLLKNGLAFFQSAFP